MVEEVKSYDLIVIGGGSGGLGCAKRAASYGKKVALIEQAKIGGTCVNQGCVPKKLIYYTSQIWEDMELGKDYGISFDNKKLGWKELKGKRDAYLLKLHSIHHSGTEKAKVDWFDGKAKFLTAHEIEVTDPAGKATKFTAPHVVIATGSKSIMPGKLPGIQHTFSSEGFFKLEELPKNMFIIGGGYIGVEISCMLATFGVKTTICMLEPSIVWPFDREITALQMETMKKMGVGILTEARVMGVEKLGEKHYKVNFDKQPSVEAEMVMCAMGRMANYDGLDIDKIGIKLTPMRAIEADEFENTNVPGVYAIGDVNAKLMLTPVAIAAGRKLADRLFGGKSDSKLCYDNICSVVFSHPPMCKCGMSEEEAKEKYGADKIKVYRTQFNQLCYALTEHKVPTLMKMVVLLPDEKVLGLHGVGKGIDELIQGFGVAVRMGCTKKDLDDTVAIHPTASEEFVTMKQIKATNFLTL